MERLETPSAGGATPPDKGMALRLADAALSNVSRLKTTHPCTYNSLPNGTAHTSGGYSGSLRSRHPPAEARRHEGLAMADFRELLEAQLPRLRRYAVALTRHPDQADDLVQDTLARALAKEHLWETGTDLRAWLFTILHNQRVNEVRRGVREGTPVDIDDARQAIVATTDPSASRTLFELDRAMGQIAEEHRQVILLIGLEGMSYEDAAAVVGVPIGTIRSRLSRGRDALRAKMGIPDERQLARAA